MGQFPHGWAYCRYPSPPQSVPSTDLLSHNPQPFAHSPWGALPGTCCRGMLAC